MASHHEHNFLFLPEISTTPPTLKELAVLMIV
jgi:hypothetical protein